VVFFIFVTYIYGLKLTNRHKFLLIIFALAAISVSLQSYYSPLKELWGGKYTTYNNYIIFKSSTFHLLNHVNLYDRCPGEYADFYKYSPTFAVLFMPVGLFPDGVGLTLWNLLNALLLLLAFFGLKAGTNRMSTLFLVFLLVDLVTSMQSSQSNALMTGLLIMAYSEVKKGNHFLSALLISLATMIKIYAGLGFLLFFFVGNQRRFLVYSTVCMVGLVLLPVILIGFKELWWQYENWKHLLAWDREASTGTSLIGIIGLVMPMDAVKLPLQLIGGVLLLLPLFVVRDRNEKFERDFLAFILVWMILFNHKAESPAFIIAFSGATLWIMNHLQNRWALLAYIVAFVLGCFTSTDVFPYDLRQFFLAVHMKAFAYIPVLVMMYTGLFRTEKRDRTEHQPG
jgi:hypothetical protein